MAAAPSKRDRSHLNLRAKPPQNEGQIRSIKNSKNLSQEGAQALLERIEKVRAPEKQRTEKEGLTQLLETHTPEEIATALAYVERNGTLSGESCHSPFRYLATAIDDLLQTCRKKGFTLVAQTDGQGTRNGAKPQRDERHEEEQKYAAITAQGLKLLPDPDPALQQYADRHNVIIGWPNGGTDQDQLVIQDIAMKLANVAEFKKVPQAKT